MRRLVLTTAALVAAVFFWVALTLPPSPAATGGEVDAAIRARTVGGAFHVHSNRSDGAGSIDEIAESASRAGLRFVVLTDHGDATRAPDPPAYRSGVLVIDAVEISTNGGHYIGLGLPAAPYPLGGDADAVVEDVRRLGGFGVVAHPDSPKRELAWRDWTLSVDGLEWINLDSEWRGETRTQLARAALDYIFKPGPAVASVLDRPSSTLDRWDRLSTRGTVAGLPGHDAHGGTREAEDRTGFLSFLSVPSYESSFRAFSLRVVLDRELSGDAALDARSVLDSIRGGRAFTAIDAVAGPGYLDFHGSSAGTTLLMGQTTEYSHGITLSVRSTTAAGGRVILLKDGVEAASSVGPLEFAIDRPGVYRVEVHAVGAPGAPPVPWLLSNPIVITGGRVDEAVAGEPRVVEPLRAAGEVEKDPASTAALRLEGDRRVFDFALGPGARNSQYAALAIPIPPGVAPFDRVVFDGSASGPMRVSVQLRFAGSGGERWARSVYLSETSRRVELDLNALVALDGTAARPPQTSATSLLFVVDLTNARPGTAGRFDISNLVLAASR